MLLRSSSAPVAQSLFPDCPNRNLDSGVTKNNRVTNTNERCTSKISFGHHLSLFSCNPSPFVCPSKSWLPDFSPKARTVGLRKFRRAHSESNLEGLTFSASFGLEEIYSSRILMSGHLHNHQKSMLHTEPSFSIYSGDDKSEEEFKNGDFVKKKLIENEGKLERSATIGQSIESQFSFGRNAMLIIEENDNEDEEIDAEEEEKEKKMALNKFKDLKIEVQGESINPPIYLATGAGGNELKFGDYGVEFGPSSSDHNGDLEKYYKKMIRECPSTPLVLRNYAQYLESKRDFSGAEEYYFRATLADPKDGEILSQYAKLVWEVHGDQARASSYFERATQAAPEDSNVLAAYASFLWDIDDSEEEEHLSNTQVNEDSVQADFLAMEFKEETKPSSPPLHLAMGLGLDIAGFGGGNNAVDYLNTLLEGSTSVEEYYRMMIQPNPSNPLFLINYANFLHQSKGDLHGAEEYYCRAILEDPSDGYLLSLYADIVWQLYGNKDRALTYFERAVQATPQDCNVLAAYAKFLWETESEEDEIEEAQNGMPVSQEAATAANA